MRITLVAPRIDGPLLPMVYDISMGLRREDIGLRNEVDAALHRHRGEIDGILAEYGVPRVDQPASKAIQ